MRRLSGPTMTLATKELLIIEMVHLSLGITFRGWFVMDFRFSCCFWRSIVTKDLMYTLMVRPMKIVGHE